MGEIFLLVAGVVGFLFAVSMVITVLKLRRVVPTNEVHIVQYAKKTLSYGANTDFGNTYYEWPTWLPVIGVQKSILPLNNFKLNLDNYEALDSGRLPFEIDIQAFFRITESNKAAARISNFAELCDQLTAIVKGAARVVLAASDIEEILSGRSTLGKRFTDEVDDKLASEFGVAVVGHIELMDIRDSNDSRVIHNIMEKKKSHIEMESRQEVAKNKKQASISEIEAQQEIDLKDQDAKQAVGLRTIEAQQKVELQEQTKIQTVKEQERLTKEKEMSVLQVDTIRRADINREAAVVKAKQDKETAVLAAEATKETTVLNAEGLLETKKREAEGITLEGTARAEAEKALQLAPVQAQITLAKEIGSNKEYQQYLITIEQVKAQAEVGKANAAALEKANVKVIANAGNAANGLNSVADIFSSAGGTQMGAMLEGLANTEVGQKVLSKFVGEAVTEEKKTVANGNGAYANGNGKAKDF